MGIIDTIKKSYISTRCLLGLQRRRSLIRVRTRTFHMLESIPVWQALNHDATDPVVLVA
jgi:hypothetical protein